MPESRTRVSFVSPTCRLLSRGPWATHQWLLTHHGSQRGVLTITFVQMLPENNLLVGRGPGSGSGVPSFPHKAGDPRMVFPRRVRARYPDGTIGHLMLLLLEIHEEAALWSCYPLESPPASHSVL